MRQPNVSLYQLGPIAEARIRHYRLCVASIRTVDGSSIERFNQVNGTMDELETFNYAIHPAVHDDYVMTQKDR